MTSQAELAATKAPQAPAPAETKTRRDLPMGLSWFRDSEVDKVLKAMGQRIREAYAHGYILDDYDAVAGLMDHNPKVSSHDNPTFNGQRHPQADGIEWSLGVSMEIRGFTRSSEPRKRVVILIPRATEKQIPECM